MTTNAILKTLKSEGQDFEWYPTTREMLQVVAKDIRGEISNNSFSLLDIGAGNGSALQIIEHLVEPGEYTSVTKYAIEKSKILIDQMPPDIFVVGTDFHQQTLIDKHVDVIFCNPPYSEFDHWMRRIVSEANCKLLYMVVPVRWTENRTVKDMIGRRCDIADIEDPDWENDIKYEYRKSRGRCEVLATMDFQGSEFREARARVDIIKIKFKIQSRYNPGLSVDPFDIWFEEHFKIDADREAPVNYGVGESKAKTLHNLVQGQNLIERLEELYRKDFDKLLQTYKALEEMDHDLFKELNVDLRQIREGLKLKIKGLKDLYWKELFDNLDAITSRLTSKSRGKLLGTLTEHTSVDFTAANAYAVVIWAIKNGNRYFDDQLKEVYLDITSPENVRNYKSNNHVIEDGWRFQKREASHYILDYRLIVERWSCFSDKGYDTYDFPNGLFNATNDLLNDICTVGKNLGFDVVTNSLDIEWGPGEKNEFLCRDGSVFMEVKAYKKGDHSHQG